LAAELKLFRCANVGVTRQIQSLLSNDAEMLARVHGQACNLHINVQLVNQTSAPTGFGFNIVVVDTSLREAARDVSDNLKLTLTDGDQVAIRCDRI